jgi:putative addiction module killer protein
MRLMGKFKIERYVDSTGKKPVDIWLNAQELSVNAKIEARFLIVERGSFGDHEPIGDGIWEMRYHFGPGYRVYFALSGKSIILLLCAGPKSSQKKDIKKAKEYWQDYLQRRKR